MKRIITWVSGLKITTLIVGIVLLGLGFYFVFGGEGKNGEDLLTIQSGDFVKQVFVSGTVKATQSVELGFAQGGRVSRVYAKVGDKVVQGSVLAEVENGDIRALILQKQAALESAQAELASLKEGNRPEEIAVSQSQVLKDEAALEQTEQELVNTIRDAYDVSDDSVRNIVDQFVNNPRTTSPQIAFSVLDSNTKNTVETARVSIEAILNSWQESLISFSVESDLVKAETVAKQNLIAVSSLLAQASTVLSRAVTSQSVSASTISTWTADVSLARTAVNNSISGLTNAVTARRNAQSNLDISRKNLALDIAGATEADINAETARVKAAEADVSNARSQLLKTLIVAPFTGVVTKMESKVGAVASSNVSDIGLISEGAFVIESFIPEVDIAEIEIGDMADVTLDAYGSDVMFPTKVIAIEPAETVRDGVSTYKTVLEFINQDVRIKSGMTANVIITTERKTGVISVPQKIVGMRDGVRFVSVKENGEIKERIVTVGKVSSVGQIEILSGLDVGDVVVLTSLE
ncbi:MAG: hypothetical protein RJA61_690 [Candidatus Parcubacteria bacterium]|jgi:HlyD family secretion protein